ncbi:MAG: hypothetical protein ACK5PZ_05640, partial [Pirellula sp.]
MKYPVLPHLAGLRLSLGWVFGLFLFGMVFTGLSFGQEGQAGAPAVHGEADLVLPDLGNSSFLGLSGRI